MLRNCECVALVLIILIIASCVAFPAFVGNSPDASINDKSNIYGACVHNIKYSGLNSADMKALIQECVNGSKSENK